MSVPSSSRSSSASSSSASFEPLNIAILGAGNRGADVYGELISRSVNRARVVAFAEPRPERREEVGRRFGLEPSALFADPSELLANVQGLDAVVVATPDRFHVGPATQALDRGLHVLLEKPIAPDEEGVRALQRAAHAAPGTVTVAHVLRYTPFFRTIKELIDAGRIGRLIAIEHTENIGYYHFAHSYVRGNWRSEEASSPMILAKACHDLDILRWLADDRCDTIDSVGGLEHFRLENAPEGSTDRCVDGCAVERICPYSAIRFYQERFAGRSDWPISVIAPGGASADVAEALRSGPYGRCVYRCDNDVADHQLVQLEFANRVRASLVVQAFSADISRSVHLMGSHGEIRGDLAKGVLELQDFAHGRSETLNVGVAGSGHGGGDEALVHDFLERTWRRRETGGADSAPTTLDVSIESHLMAFAAERARCEGRRVSVE